MNKLKIQNTKIQLLIDDWEEELKSMVKSEKPRAALLIASFISDLKLLKGQQ